MYVHHEMGNAPASTWTGRSAKHVPQGAQLQEQTLTESGSNTSILYLLEHAFKKDQRNTDGLSSGIWRCVSSRLDDVHASYDNDTKNGLLSTAGLLTSTTLATTSDASLRYAS